MHVFTHRDHPLRVASIAPKGDGKSFVVQHTSADGKVRTKTFANGYLAALRFLLNTEGYVIRGPQDGPVRWMERIRHDYHGELHHAVEPDGGVWFVDPVGHIRRVSPDSLDTLGASLGAPSGLRASIACAPSGATWIALPEWRSGEGGLVANCRVLRVTRDPSSLAVQEVADLRAAGSTVSVSAGADGSVLGPGPRGAAFYDEAGAVVEHIPCDAIPGTGEHTLGPFAVLSPDGRWLAFTRGHGVTLVERATGKDHEMPLDFKSVNGLQVADDGALFVSGFRYPSHGLFRVDARGPDRVSADIRATVLADGRRFVEAEHSRVTLRDCDAPSDHPMELRRSVAAVELPVLGMAKYGRALPMGDGEFAVMTDAYTLACVRLKA